MSNLTIVLSGPSGSGKTTIAKQLVQLIDNLTLIRSITTRLPRIYEKNFIDYEFVTLENFLELISSNLLLEYTKVYDNYYGTPNYLVLNAINNNFSLLFDMNFNGLQALQKKFNNILSFFILPPSIELLKHRLINRSETYKTIEFRTKEYNNEIQLGKYYDYTIVNNTLNQAVQEIQSIVYKKMINNKTI